MHIKVTISARIGHIQLCVDFVPSVQPGKAFKDAMYKQNREVKQSEHMPRPVANNSTFMDLCC